jgi:hypothetical protein
MVRTDIEAIEKLAPASVAALFVRKDSAYKSLAGVDPWDVMRNAPLLAWRLSRGGASAMLAVGRLKPYGAPRS